MRSQVTGSETDPNIQESYELQTTAMPGYPLSPEVCFAEEHLQLNDFK